MSNSASLVLPFGIYALCVLIILPVTWQMRVLIKFQLSSFSTNLHSEEK